MFNYFVLKAFQWMERNDIQFVIRISKLNCFFNIFSLGLFPMCICCCYWKRPIRSNCNAFHKAKRYNIIFVKRNHLINPIPLSHNCNVSFSNRYTYFIVEVWIFTRAEASVKYSNVENGFDTWPVPQIIKKFQWFRTIGCVIIQLKR